MGTLFPPRCTSQFKSKSNRQWWRPLRWLWDIPLHLGRLATFIGTNWRDLKDRIFGLVILFAILILPVLLLVGVLKWEQVTEWLQQAFDFGK
jgi:hypothetical protein